MYKPRLFRLAGEARRIDAALAAEAVMRMEFEEYSSKGIIVDYNFMGLIEELNEFPGVGRRFERIADGVYSDYAHHPEEITATIDVAKDEAKLQGKKGVVVVYQPHQNTRQHKVRGGYANAFEGVDKICWLPTYLTRENPDLPIIAPQELIDGLNNKEIAEAAKLDDDLASKIQKYVDDGYLMILMTAGPADGWLREKFGD